MKERQDEDTLNRFEVLEDLSQHEVNPGLVDLDQGVLGSNQPGQLVELEQESGGLRLSGGRVSWGRLWSGGD